MKTKSTVYLFVFVILAITLNSCNMKKDVLIDTTEIVYNFDDSSVPPRYHRSFTVKVNSDSISLIVDSYGDILVDTTFSISAEEFDKLVDYTEECGIKNQSKKEIEEGCSGGTSKTIGAYKNEETIFYGTCYKCGGQTYGDLSGDADKFAKYITALIPEFSKYLD